MIIACVLRSGGEYTAYHVMRLYDQVRRYSPKLPFVCLSDVDLPCETVELAHDWPHWWPKMELFRVFRREKVLFLDLDTDILTDLTPFFRSEMTMLSDFYRPHLPASGVMAWEGDFSYLYDKFAKDPGKYMRTYLRCPRVGDGAFIGEHLGFDAARFGEEIVSYKVHCRAGVPAHAKIIAYHGRPKPWDLPKPPQRAAF